MKPKIEFAPSYELLSEKLTSFISFRFYIEDFEGLNDFSFVAKSWHRVNGLDTFSATKN